MPRRRKGFGIIEIVVLIATIGIVAAAFYIKFSVKKPTSTPVAAKATPTLAPSPTTALETPEPIPTLSKSFSEIMQELEDSQINELNDSHPGPYIDPTKLPVTIDFGKLGMTVPAHGLIKGLETDGYVMLYDINVNIYNDDSKEPGHGGAPFLGEVGTLAHQAPEIKYFIYLEPGDAGPRIIGNTPVLLRAIKTMRLSNSETIYANTSTKIIAADDPDLISFLEQFSRPCDNNCIKLFPDNSNSDKLIIDFESFDHTTINSEIASHFFSDWDNLPKEQQKIVGEVTTKLSAISPK